MPLNARVVGILLALPPQPTTADLLLAFGKAEDAGFERGQAELKSAFTLVPVNPEHVTMPESEGPYARIVLEHGQVGNALSDARERQIRSLLRHFNWKTERARLLKALDEIDVRGEIDAEKREGSFYDYREQGWLIARVVPV